MKKFDNINDDIQQLLDNITDYNDIHDNFTAINKIYDTQIKDIKKLKIFFEARLIFDPESQETKSWEKILLNSIIEHYNKNQKTLLSVKDKDPNKTNISKDIENLNTLLNDMQNDVIGKFLNNEPFKSYRLNIMKKINTDKKILLKQETIDDSEKKELTELGDSILTFLTCVVEGNKPKLFSDFKIYREKLIEFLKTCHQYAEKRSEANDDIEDPYIRELFDTESLSIGELGGNKIDEIINKIDDKFPDLKKNLKLSF